LGEIKMKIETLKEKIKNTEDKINKLNSTLERHRNQLTKKSTLLIEKGIDLQNYNKYDKKKIDEDTYWQLCEYEREQEDIDNNLKKIRIATKTLEELNEKLENQLAKDKEYDDIIPESLNIFLNNWKKGCIEYYTNLANEYLEVVLKEYEITKEELELLTEKCYISKLGTYKMVRMYTDEEINKILSNISDKNDYYIKYSIKERHKRDFINKHMKGDMVVVLKITESDIINHDKLEKIVSYDVKVKREMFIDKIMAVIGTIKDLSGLKIGANGELNGIAIGVKCNAKVETIIAGGYNIQCEHFRVLVNTVK
jgi:hypothetical protein